MKGCQNWEKSCPPMNGKARTMLYTCQNSLQNQAFFQTFSKSSVALSKLIHIKHKCFLTMRDAKQRRSLGGWGMIKPTYILRFQNGRCSCVCGNYERLSDAMWWTRCTFKVSGGVILSTYTHAHSLVCSRKHSCGLDCKSCMGSAHRRPAHLGLMLPAQDTFPCAPSIPGWLPFQPAAQVTAPVVNTAVAEM